MPRDSSELTENEVTVDYLTNLKNTLRELKKSKLNPSTPEEPDFLSKLIIPASRMRQAFRFGVVDKVS